MAMIPYPERPLRFHAIMFHGAHLYISYVICIVVVSIDLGDAKSFVTSAVCLRLVRYSFVIM